MFHLNQTIDEQLQKVFKIFNVFLDIIILFSVIDFKVDA